jgi:hypothetical protein
MSGGPYEKRLMPGLKGDEKVLKLCFTRWDSTAFLTRMLRLLITTLNLFISIIAEG